MVGAEIDGFKRGIDELVDLGDVLFIVITPPVLVKNCHWLNYIIYSSKLSNIF